MCYFLVFGHLVCNNDHPQPGSGEIFQRQCRAQAEESERTKTWNIKCGRYTPPFFVFEKPNKHMIITSNSDCKTCRAIEADPELKRLQTISDKISDKRDTRKANLAKVKEKFTNEVYLRTVTTEIDRQKYQDDITRYEKWQKTLETQIKSLTLDLEEAENNWLDRRNIIEEPDEDDFVDVALEEYERDGNQFGKRGHLFYYGRPSRKEVGEHPFHYPRCFPPEWMLRWHSERHKQPYPWLT